jgi:LmbE family N-acetylglucosaminyl deacetylase
VTFAKRLASGARIEEPVAVVVAHPDDESLWLGTALLRMPNTTLIHLTDGAPEDMRDAERLGFATRQAYAAARAQELDAALAALDVQPRRLAYGHVDQSLAENLPELIAGLRADLLGMRVAVTHPYEGGHPDHDAAAFAVRTAFSGEVVEFACYHLAEGGRVYGRFWPDEHSPEHVRVLDDAERQRVNGAIAAHRTQAEVIGGWRPAVERWRTAPAYDFSAPPPSGRALYDEWGWELTSAKWRALAARC